MFQHVLMMIFGMALLGVGGDRFVVGAASLAKRSGVSPLIIGTVLVGCVGSFPEIWVSIVAAQQGHFELSLGNALGSYVTNTTLVLGVSALVSPLLVDVLLIRRELPIMIGCLLFSFFLILNGYLGRLDAILLLSLLVLLLGLLLWSLLRKNKPENIAMSVLEEHADQTPLSAGVWGSWGWLVLGLVALSVGSKLMVNSATELVLWLGVSEIVVGLTVLAVGTSLPELVASVVAAARNEPDIALGNVIGSNIVCVLGLVAIPGLLSPDVVPIVVMWRDYGSMFFCTAILFVMVLKFDAKACINRYEGAGLVVAYVAYLVLVSQFSH